MNVFLLSLAQNTGSEFSLSSVCIVLGGIRWIGFVVGGGCFGGLSEGKRNMSGEGCEAGVGMGLWIDDILRLREVESDVARLEFVRDCRSTRDNRGLTTFFAAG